MAPPPAILLRREGNADIDALAALDGYAGLLHTRGCGSVPRHGSSAAEAEGRLRRLEIGVLVGFLGDLCVFDVVLFADLGQFQRPDADHLKVVAALGAR